MKYIKCNILFIFISISILVSCVTVNKWDQSIPNNKKAEFLFKFLSEQYQVALGKEDLIRLNQIMQELNQVIKLDENYLYKVNNLNLTINRSILYITNKRIKRAKTFIQKKDFFNAGYEYNVVKTVDPKNKQAEDFFTKYYNELNLSVEKIIETIKDLIKGKKYSKAGEYLEKLKLMHFDVKISTLNIELERQKKAEADLLLKNAKQYYNQKNYDKAINNAQAAINLIPTNKEANRFLSEALEMKKKQKSKQTISTQNANAETFYKNSLTYYNRKNYLAARQEVNKFLAISNQQKGRDLSTKINAAIKTEVNNLMIEAKTFYNSQKYENALKKFNEVLLLSPDNEEAFDYKTRIEKRMQSFE